MYIYSGRFAAWITYSLITPQYALRCAYILKYRNFQFYIIHICIRILCYICMPVQSALRGHKYLLICFIFFHYAFSNISTVISILLFLYICIIYIHICIRSASCSLTYVILHIYVFLLYMCTERFCSRLLTYFLQYCPFAFSTISTVILLI